MRKSFLTKVIGTVCVLSLLLGALYVPLSFGASAANIPVTENEVMVFSFETDENPVKNISDPNNLTRGDDGIGIAGWGLKPRTDGDVNGIGVLHDYDADWPDPGGYRLNNNDGVYNLETNTTYVVKFKVRVKSAPVKEGSFNKDVASVLKFGYGFKGGTTGNTCSSMSVVVSEVVSAQSVEKADKDNAVFTLNNMNISKEVQVGNDWHEVSYAFTTPAAFGDYVPSLGFYSSCYHGTDFMVDDVEVTRLGANKGVVVLYDEFSGTNEIVVGETDTAVELPELTGEYEFRGWFKDANRTESAEGLTFVNGVQTLYTGWKAPVTVTFIDALNGGEPYVATGIPGAEIVYPETPVDNVNEPDKNWFMGWYTTEGYTEEFTAATFGYSNCNVYAKWQGEYTTYTEDFENYTLDTRGGYTYDENRGNVYHSAYQFGTAMKKVDDPTNSGKGKVVAMPWDSTQTKDASDRNSDPATYNAASFYKGADNIVQIKSAKLTENVMYKVSFEYFVEKMDDSQNLTIYPIAAHDSGYWSTQVNFKNTQNTYAVITPDANDGEWHTAEMIFTMKKAAAANDVIHFMFDLNKNSDTTVYVDNIVFTPVQLDESLIVYVANNGEEKKLVTGVPGEAIPEYIPENKGLAFDGWYTDSAFETKYEATAFERGGVTLFAKWVGEAIEFTDRKAGGPSLFPISFSVVNQPGGGIEDNWAIKWHYDGDVKWVDEAKSPMYKRGIGDHILYLTRVEKGKTYEVSYWLNVEKASNDINVQFFTTNPGYVWDKMQSYETTYKNISKAETEGKGWIKYTTMLTVSTREDVMDGLYMGLVGDKRAETDDTVVYIDRVVVKPVTTGAILFNTGISERDGDWQNGKVGEKINYPTISGVRGELFDGWYLDKEYTKPYTSTVLEEGVVNVYAKWTGDLIEFTNYKKNSTAIFGQAMYVMEEDNVGLEDGWAIKWHYDGDAEWKQPKSLMYQRGAAGDHVVNLKILDKGTYEISYWVKVEKASNDFTVSFLTSNIGYIWDPQIVYDSSYKTISKDAAGKGWQRYSVMIDIDTDYTYRKWQGDDVIANNGLFMSLNAINRAPEDENIVYIDAVVIKPVDTAVIFHTNSSSDGSYQKGKAGDTIKFPENPTKFGCDFIGWFADKECTVPFTATTLEENTVYNAYAGYSRSSKVLYDFETYNFSNPTGWFVWDEGGEVALFDKAYSGRKAARFNRDLEVTHNGRGSFTLVGHDNEAYTIDADKEYLVTFKYYVEKAGEKDATIAFTSGNKTSYWHMIGALSSSFVVPFSEKTGVWHDGVLVLDGSKIKDEINNALFVVVNGGNNGIYYVDDITINVVPDGYKAYTVDNAGCDKVPMYVMGKLGTSFANQLPNAPVMSNHHFGGYSYYDVNNNLSDLLPEKMVFTEDNIRIVTNFIRIETIQDFDDGYDALLNAYGDYSAMDFDYEHYDSTADGNSKDNVTSGRYSLHRKGNTYHFENVQILTAVKSLTPNQKYTVTMKVKLGKHFHTDGAIKLVSCRTPYYPWAASGDYFSIAAIKDLKENEWTDVTFTFTAVESFISLQTPGYVELFIDDVKFTRVDGTVETSKNVSFTEYVPAKRDADGNLIARNPMDVSVESIIDANLGKNQGSPVMLYVIIGGAAVIVIAVAVVVLLLLKKRKNKKA